MAIYIYICESKRLCRRFRSKKYWLDIEQTRDNTWQRNTGLLRHWRIRRHTDATYQISIKRGGVIVGLYVRFYTKIPWWDYIYFTGYIMNLKGPSKYRQEPITWDLYSHSSAETSACFEASTGWGAGLLVDCTWFRVITSSSFWMRFATCSDVGERLPQVPSSSTV